MTEMVPGFRHGLPQQRKSTPKTFTVRKRQRFLDALALTCNVKHSADHAEVSNVTAYYHRRRDAAFAAQWDEALAAGYARLVALVLEHGGAGEALEPGDAERAAGAIAAAPRPGDPPPFDFERALKVLRFQQLKQVKGPFKESRRPGAATREETNAVLVKALAAAQRRLARIPPHE